MTPRTEIYTDGSLVAGRGGGWSAVFRYADGTEEVLAGGETASDSNRMELLAIVRALETLALPSKVSILADCKSIVRDASRRLPYFQANGWRRPSGRPVKDLDLWRRLEIAAAPHDIEWQWIKGHSGNPGNVLADKVAQSTAVALLATREHRERIERAAA